MWFSIVVRIALTNDLMSDAWSQHVGHHHSGPPKKELPEIRPFEASTGKKLRKPIEIGVLARSFAELMSDWEGGQAQLSGV
tara:strand:- start:249 stop:491 length:243 start_codon:yes stop_codon:yes gene_type:complete